MGVCVFSLAAVFILSSLVFPLWFESSALMVDPFFFDAGPLRSQLLLRQIGCCSSAHPQIFCLKGGSKSSCCGCAKQRGYFVRDWLHYLKLIGRQT